MQISNSQVQLKNQNRLMSNMILLLLGRLVSLLGSQIYSFAISLYVLKTTGSGSSFAATMVFSSLPRIILGPVAGVVADKVNRKKMVVIMDFLSGIIIISLFAVALLDTLRLPYIYAASFLLSTCSIFFDIPFRSSIPNIVDEKNLMRITSLSNGISSIAQIGGPFLGGLVFAIIDIKLFLLVNGVSFIISSITEIFIDFNFNKPKEAVQKNTNIENKTADSIGGSFFKELNEGFIFLKSKKTLFVISMFFVILNFLFMFGSIIPYKYILTKVVCVSESQLGVLDAIFAVGMLLGAALLSILKEKEKKFKSFFLNLIIIETCILFIGIPIIPRLMVFNKFTYFIFYMINFLIFGIAAQFVFIPLNVMIQREIPNNLRGRVHSLIGTLSNILNPTAIILSGVLLDLIPAYVMPISAGIILLICTVFMAFNKEIRSI